MFRHVKEADIVDKTWAVCDKEGVVWTYVRTDGNCVWKVKRGEKEVEAVELEIKEKGDKANTLGGRYGYLKREHLENRKKKNKQAVVEKPLRLVFTGDLTKAQVKASPNPTIYTPVYSESKGSSMVVWQCVVVEGGEPKAQPDMTFEKKEKSKEYCWVLMEEDDMYWESHQASSVVSDGSDVEEHGVNDDQLREDDRDEV